VGALIAAGVILAVWGTWHLVERNHSTTTSADLLTKEAAASPTPPGAQLAHTETQDDACSDDGSSDGVTQSLLQFDYSGKRNDLISFYEQTAVARGWSKSSNVGAGNIARFNRVLNGQQLILSISDPAQTNGSYQLAVSSKNSANCQT
jgi:hypothetical protein